MARITHIALRFDGVDAFSARLTAFCAEIVSEAGKLPVKFRAPGGSIAEVVPVGRYRKKTLAEGRHGPVIE